MGQSYAFGEPIFTSRWCSSQVAAQQDQKPGWSWDEVKIFENSVAVVGLNSPNLLGELASRIPGKTVEQIQKHLNALIEDVRMIDSGLVPLPHYQDKAIVSRVRTNRCTKGEKAPMTAPLADEKTRKQKRKKGIPWTSEEHELFLTGLQKYGKGDWRSISRHCVVTKTPIQIASHAQKYFLRVQRPSSRPIEG